MAMKKKFWALAIGRIMTGEVLPGRLVERVTLVEKIHAEEGAQIDHPRLGRIALFTNKENLAREAVRRMNMAKVNKHAFLKKYGHWLNEPAANNPGRVPEAHKPGRPPAPRYAVIWPPQPFTLDNAMQPCDVGMTPHIAVAELYQHIRNSPPGFMPSGFARQFMRKYGHLLHRTRAQ